MDLFHNIPKTKPKRKAAPRQQSGRLRHDGHTLKHVHKVLATMGGWPTPSTIRHTGRAITRMRLGAVGW